VTFTWFLSFTLKGRNQVKGEFMRGGYRGIPKPKLPPHLKRVHVNARIQKWMLDELKKQGEVGIVLEYILGEKAGFKYKPE
jgi:hypothetical protein